MGLWCVLSQPGSVDSCNHPTCLFHVQINNALMWYMGAEKKDFDSRWKGFLIIKKAMEDRVSLFKMESGDTLPLFTNQNGTG